MPFLALNGATIPVDFAGAYDVTEIGQRDRALDGTYMRDTRAFKRKWQFATKPMPDLQSVAVENIIKGVGLVFPWEAPNPLYAQNGFPPSGTITQFSAIAADGGGVLDENGVSYAKFGNGSVAAEDAATNPNMVSSTVAHCSATTGMSFAAGATGSIVTSAAWEGSNCLKVQGDTVTPGPSVRLQSNITGIAGQIYTVSVYVKGTGTCFINFFDNANSVDVHSPVVTLSTTVWRRISATLTAGSGSTPSLYIDVVCNEASAVYYVDGVLLEKSPFTWSWVAPGSNRIGQSLIYVTPPVGNAGCTVNLWMTKPPGTGGAEYLFDIFDAAVSTRLYAYAANSNELDFKSTTTAGDDTGITVTGLTFTGWTMVTAVFRTQPEAGEHYLSLYKNGVLIGTRDPPAQYIPAANALTRFIPMNAFSFGGSGIFRSDDFQMLPYPVDAATVAGWYGNAFPASMPVLVATGSFSPQGAINVHGQVTKVSFLSHATSDGTWRNSGRVIDFTLEEA